MQFFFQVSNFNLTSDLDLRAKNHRLIRIDYCTVYCILLSSNKELILIKLQS